MRAARETIPATGKKAPPLSPLEVAMRLAALAADSMTDPSTNMLGAVGAERPDMATAWLTGATKAEAAATRRARRKRERILAIV